MTELSQQNNKRIAKNTLLLYFRMLFMMAISLYTSRVVLNTLGVEDFGIYNVVGGIVTMFGFINAAMMSSTQRFITFVLGKGDESELSKVFSTSLIIHVIISIIIIVLAETIGLWLLYHKMTIPIERMNAALWVFQFAIGATVVMVMSVPYNAVIIAHERMGAFAYISILEVILKLLIVYVLALSYCDKLKLYAVLIFVIQLLIRSIYSIYCKRHFSETHFVRTIDKKLFCKMLSFACWTMNGNLAVIGYTQGLNVLLNIFFNPVVNAARGIAVQVQGAVLNFCRNFQMAINPQITKSYSAQNYHYMHQLVFASSRYSFYLLVLLSLPIFLGAKPILFLWLGMVPEYTVSFVRLMLVISLLTCLSTPLVISVHATGIIRKFQLWEGGILLLIVPLSYICLEVGLPPESVFLVHFGIEILAQIIRIWIVSPMIKMSSKDYVINVIYPVLKFTLCSFLLPVGTYFLFPAFWDKYVLIAILGCVINVLFFIYLNLSSSEKKILSANGRKSFYAIRKGLYWE